MYDIFSEELFDVERSLEVLEEQTNIRYRSRAMQKGLEKRQENLRAKLAELKHNIDERKDECLDFHTMGIDHLFVDECHYQYFCQFPKKTIKYLITLLLYFCIVRIIY